MPDKWAYEMTDKELVERFMQVMAEAGASNSGLVIDFTADFKLQEAHYFKGVVLARLAGANPPFKRGVTVQVSPKLLGGVRSTNYDRESYSHCKLDAGSIHKITRIHYIDSQWQLSFEGPGVDYRFKADDFLSAPQQESSKVA